MTTTPDVSTAARRCPRSGAVAAVAAAASTAVSRRTVLKTGAMGAAFAALGSVGRQRIVERKSFVAPASLPDIQFAIGDYLGPAVPASSLGDPGAPPDTMFGFGPVYTLFLTVKLTRTPTMSDRTVFAAALRAIEDSYEFSASGVFTHVSYGIPYFNRLPGGIDGRLVTDHLPRLSDDASRFALEEAVPGPTDVHPNNPGVFKPRFPVPVVIEGNDLLITLRSDTTAPLYEIESWLQGSDKLAGSYVPSPAFRGLLRITSERLMFGGRGIPRKLADQDLLPYRHMVHPDSPMWMGFADQVASAFAPPEQVCFQGSPVARLTDVTAASYFFNGSIQVLNHVILDLTEWYLTNHTEQNNPIDRDLSYLERVQYMYRPNSPASFGREDQFTDSGGPTFLPNIFQGADDARTGCTFGSYQPGFDAANPIVVQEHKILGHTQCLHRASRASDGTPLHIRVDGPGYDAMDVPDGSIQPKLQFSALVPTSDLFRRMRVAQASEDLVQEFKVEPGDRGLEGRISATRRQNFLMPRRENRAFPLLELNHRSGARR